jgi:hypothetical protein
MGHRVRLGFVAKEYRDACAHLENNDAWFRERYEFDADDEPICSDSPVRPSEHTQIYEIGKYVSFSDGMEDFYPFHLDESEFKICTKADLARIIGEYHSMIAEYYNKLGTKCGTDFETHKLTMITEWSNGFMNPYYLDETRKDGAIVQSWMREYAIFNLVHIYQTFDFDKNYLIYSAC